MKLASSPAALGSLAALSLSLLITLPCIAQTLTGQNAFTDYSKEHPGVRRKLTAADLPQPYATPSANNGPAISPRPDGVWPQAPAGFKVEQFATGLDNPRLMRMAPKRRHLSRRKRRGQDCGLSRHRQRRQGRPNGSLRHWP